MPQIWIAWLLFCNCQNISSLCVIGSVQYPKYFGSNEDRPKKALFLKNLFVMEIFSSTCLNMTSCKKKENSHLTTAHIVKVAGLFLFREDNSHWETLHFVSIYKTVSKFFTFIRYHSNEQVTLTRQPLDRH